VAADTVLGMKKQRVCPACQGSDFKEIVYGLPDIESFDFEKHAVGGCCVSDNDPGFKCKSCDLEF
jgi:hypothetical protein